MMKRDMDLIRKMMIHITPDGWEPVTIIPEDYEKFGFSPDDAAGDVIAMLSYHIVLMVGAGFFCTTGRVTDSYVALPALTWEGYNFLDMIKDDDVWKKIKSMCECAESTCGSLEVYDVH